MSLFHAINNKTTINPAAVELQPEIPKQAKSEDIYTSLEARYYRSFYEKLFSPNLISHSSRSAALFLNLLYIVVF